MDKGFPGRTEIRKSGNSHIGSRYRPTGRMLDKNNLKSLSLVLSRVLLGGLFEHRANEIYAMKHDRKILVLEFKARRS